jgi:hypothetical protein
MRGDPSVNISMALRHELTAVNQYHHFMQVLDALHIDPSLNSSLNSTPSITSASRPKT